MQVHSRRRLVVFTLLFAAFVFTTAFAQPAHLIADFEFASGFTKVETVDMDGDSDLDVIWSSFNNTNRLAWAEQLDPLTWDLHVIVSDDSVDYVEIFGIVDIDLDSDLDIFVRREVDGDAEYAWYEQSPNGWTSHTIHGSDGISHQSKLPQICDYDNDGDMDYLCREYENEIDLYVILNNGNAGWSAQFLHSLVIEIDPNTEILVSFLPGDFNNDGLTDVVLGSVGDGNWLYNGVYILYHGEDELTVLNRQSGSSYVVIHEVLDFNNDGLEDILFARESDLNTNLLTQTTPDHFELTTLCGFGTEIEFWSETATLDYNCDGHLDFFFSDSDHPDYPGGVLLYNQDLSFRPEHTGGSGILAYGDIDNDGDPDYISQLFGFEWYENERSIGYGRIRLIPVTATAAPGESVVYGATIFHAAQTPVTATIAAHAQGQQGGQLPLFNASIPLIPSQSIDYNGLTLDVPTWAQPGQYLVTIKLHYQGYTAASGQMVVTVTGEPSEVRPENWREGVATGGHGWE